MDTYFEKATKGLKWASFVQPLSNRQFVLGLGKGGL